MALDSAGNLWVASTGSNSQGSGQGIVTEIPLDAPTAPLTWCSAGCTVTTSLLPSSMQNYNLPSLYVDANDNIWVAVSSNSSTSNLSSVVEIPYAGGQYGTPVSISLGTSTLSGISGIVIDENGNLWVASSSISGSKYNSGYAGALKVTSPGGTSPTFTVYNPTFSYVNSGGTTPQSTNATSAFGIAADKAGHVWLATLGYAQSSGSFGLGEKGIIFEISITTGTTVSFCSSGCSNDNLPAGYNPGYSGSSTSSATPNIAVDVSGNVWTTLFGPGTVGSDLTEILAGSTASSPAANFPTYCNNSSAPCTYSLAAVTPLYTAQLSGLAISSSGDVWVPSATTDSGGSSSMPEIVKIAPGPPVSGLSYCDPSGLFNGCAGFVSLQSPSGVVVDPKTGNLWIANSGWITELPGVAK